MVTEAHVGKLSAWQIRYLLKTEFLVPPKEIPSHKVPLVAMYWKKISEDRAAGGEAAV